MRQVAKNPPLAFAAAVRKQADLPLPARALPPGPMGAEFGPQRGAVRTEGEEGSDATQSS